LQSIIEATQADELIVSSDAFRREDRLRSYEVIAQVAGLEQLASGVPRAAD
jgi:hypothetical protein